MAGTARHDEVAQELKQLMGFVTSIGAEFARGNQTNAIQGMENLAREIIELDYEVSHQKSTQQKVMEAIRAMNEDTVIEDIVNGITSAPRKNGPVESHSFMSNFQKEIQRNTRQADDDDVETVAATSATKCPLSLKWLSDPMKNTNCGHHYDRATIIQHMGRQRQTKCPVAGCSALVVPDSLIFDEEKKSQIEHEIRKQRSRIQEDEETVDVDLTD